MEAMKKGISGIMRVFAVIAAMVMICLGCYLFVRPASVVLIFSAAVLVRGVQMLIGYIFTKGGRNGWEAIGGVINILFGGIMLFGGALDKVAGLLAIEVFIAVWAVFTGFSQVFGSFNMKKQKVKGWVWNLIGGILTVICGIIFVSMPVAGTLALVGFAGIYAGVMFLITGLTGLAGALSSSGDTASKTADSADDGSKGQEA